MFCTLLRPRYQVSVYRTIGPLVYYVSSLGMIAFPQSCFNEKKRIFAVLFLSK